MKRNTIQRTLTLEAVRKLANHPTADEVYEEVIKTYPSISKGTVYRNLNQLCEDDMLTLIDVPGSPSRFDHNLHFHYHGKCRKCGKVFDVDLNQIPNLDEYIVDTHGLNIEEFDISFKGKCTECQ